jgi:hypothetical protein
MSLSTQKTSKPGSPSNIPGSSSSARPDPSPFYLHAFRTHPAAPVPQAASVRRDWMDSSHDRFANRCLPLLLGNQAGWIIPSTCTARVCWSGDRSKESLSIVTDEDSSPVHPVSHFGHGVLTWSIPYIFKTPPGYNLLVRGPSNSPKDAIQALDAIVETDWFQATFTMNWVVTRPYHTVTFERGEPICMVVPQRRGELEDVRPTIGGLTDQPILASRFESWRRSRETFISDLRNGAEQAVKQGWQRDYFLGRDVDGHDAPEHQKRLRLREFQEESETA